MVEELMRCFSTQLGQRIWPAVGTLFEPNKADVPHREFIRPQSQSGSYVSAMLTVRLEWGDYNADV
jgi:hypothetical protein